MVSVRPQGPQGKTLQRTWIYISKICYTYCQLFFNRPQTKNIKKLNVCLFKGQVKKYSFSLKTIKSLYIGTINKEIDVTSQDKNLLFWNSTLFKSLEEEILLLRFVFCFLAYSSRKKTYKNWPVNKSKKNSRKTADKNFRIPSAILSIFQTFRHKSRKKRKFICVYVLEWCRTNG